MVAPTRVYRILGVDLDLRQTAFVNLCLRQEASLDQLRGVASCYRILIPPNDQSRQPGAMRPARVRTAQAMGTLPFRER